MVQPLPQPQMPWMKLARMSLPRGVWTTSGWNWMPKSRRLRSSMAANSELSVVATVRKPVGILVSLSPWLFQTWSDLGSFLKSAHEPSRTESAALPYSRCCPFSTLPPRKWASTCTP